MRCPACSVENPDGMRFCGRCGAALATTCAACGGDVVQGNRFCGHCGTLIGTATVATPVPPVVPGAALPPITPDDQSSVTVGNTTELRHVSVLFCDLVGFTPLAESKDPEDVRELLSGYFELSRAIIARYGGIVEKFIGDAVMAVWGAPIAKEDDAERAVRAGLELVSAVAARVVSST